MPESGSAEQRGPRYGLPSADRLAELTLFCNKEGTAVFVYCLFCRTQRARRIAELLETCGLHRAFTPRVICRHRVQGRLVDKPYDLLPGYVFLFAEEEITDFSFLRRIDGVGRLVGRREDRYELSGTDRTFAEQLYEAEGLVNPMPLVHEGKQVRLLNPLFQNSHGVITEIDYKKQRARVEFTFDEERWIAWVAIEELRL